MLNVLNEQVKGTSSTEVQQQLMICCNHIRRTRSAGSECF